MKNFKLLIITVLMATMATIYSCKCKVCTDESATPVSNETDCHGAEIASADLAITELSVDETSTSLTITLKVRLINDDTANDVKLYVLLPVEANVVSFASTDAAVKSKQCGGYVIYSWSSTNPCNGNVANEGNCTKTFTIVTGRFKNCDGVRGTIADGHCVENVLAFITSITPDENHSNNYKYWESTSCKKIDPGLGCKYLFLKDCKVPELGDGFIDFPSCPGSDETCFFPEDVDDLCKRAINCPGCDFSSLCIGDEFEFENAEDFTATLYLVEADMSGKPLMELKPENGKIILAGNEQTQSIKKEQRLVIVFKPVKPLSEPVKVAFKYTGKNKKA